MTDREHKDCPKVVGRENSIEFSHLAIVVRLVKVVEVEKPQSWEKHQDNVDPGLRKRSKTEEKLTDDLVDNENNFSVRRFS